MSGYGYTPRSPYDTGYAANPRAYDTPAYPAGGYASYPYDDRYGSPSARGPYGTGPYGAGAGPGPVGPYGAGPYGSGPRGPICGDGSCLSDRVGSMMAFTGVGDYVQESTYRYVGNGAGTHSFLPVGGRPRCWLCCIPLVLLLLIPLLLFASTSTPAPPELVAPPPLGPTGSCTIYGDPHIMTFDGSHEDYYTPGEYWIVRSDTVHIQGSYAALPMTNGLACTKAIAIGGPFLQGHKLIIQALDKGPNFATYDGQPFGGGQFPLSWISPDRLVEVMYNSHGGTMQAGRTGKAMHVLHLKLPFGVFIQINQWNEPSEGAYMNIKITMSAQPNQDGHCGNFNGNAADDARVEVRSRVGRTGVAPNLLMFPWPKTPVNPGNRPDMNDCPTGTLKTAKDMCRKKEGSFFPTPACLIDACFAGGVM